MRSYRMCSMIILYDPFNDSYGDFFFFAQLVFSTYLSVVLLNTSHTLRLEGPKSWNQFRGNGLIGIL